MSPITGHTAKLHFLLVLKLSYEDSTAKTIHSHFDLMSYFSILLSPKAFLIIGL